MTDNYPFSERIRIDKASMMWFAGGPTGEEKKMLADYYHKGSGKKRKKTVYFHVPYCSSLCNFCGFFRSPGNSDNVSSYLLSVLKELKYTAESRYASEGGFEAVFLGGGSPSLIPTSMMEETIMTFYDAFNLDEDVEFTMECAVHDLNEDKLSAMKNSGVNRISFGVQSFDTERRKMLGRISSCKETVRTIKTARGTGIKTISVDLLYRLPGESTEAFLDDIKTAVDLGVDGVSIYPLIEMKGTPLPSLISKGKLPELPPVETEIEQYSKASEILLSQGFRQDNITHFIKEDRNLYSTIRYEGGDTYPIGAGAGGNIGSLAMMNAMNVKMYEKFVGIKKSGLMGSVKIRDEDLPLRSVLGQANKGYMDPDQMDGRDTCSFDAIFKPLMEKFIKLNLVEWKNSRYEFTEKGFIWGKNILHEISSLGNRKSK